ncbi:MAG: hypothetical protein MUD01_28305 [Chloroflexaceae bacterium]|nr:hypothetical protein [Chloroflexaceae bacterium]
MGLTKSQQILIAKARNPGGSELGVFLDDATCAYLVAVIIADLGLAHHFPEMPTALPPFFHTQPIEKLRIENLDAIALLERLLALRSDADTYFYCLATLHKARLKYERILQVQALPIIEQVGPRGLLQYGILSPQSLVALLFWRKWMYDIDNRAAQETGYIFEPIIAYAIGGVPYSAKRSPVKRGGLGSSGRQVDCMLDNRAYEIKIRVTIAASGQGRWSEELAFPKDCKASGFIPMLIVLDPTPSVKLDELAQAFIAAGGESYVGHAAWSHLTSLAGPTMARFLETYVHAPLQEMLTSTLQELPDLALRIRDNSLIMQIGEDQVRIQRSRTQVVEATLDTLPDDIDEESPTG